MKMFLAATAIALTMVKAIAVAARIIFMAFLHSVSVYGRRLASLLRQPRPSRRARQYRLLSFENVMDVTENTIRQQGRMRHPAVDADGLPVQLHPFLTLRL